jgi:hypothetical protein
MSDIRALTLTLALGAGLTLTALTTGASAQDALGGGNILDRNLNKTEGPYNRPAAVPNFRARNLLVTDNVMGGRGFRGSVGYTAASDFRGVAGSDDLFRFRADSALSSLNYINYGSTFNALRFGQDMGVLTEFRRDTTGSNLRTVATGVSPTQASQARLRLDELSREFTIGADARVNAEPAALGYALDENGEPLIFTTSTVQGLSVLPLQQQVQLIGLSTYDFARIAEDSELGRPSRALGTQFDPSYANLGLGRSLPERTGPKPGGDAATAQPMKTRVDMNASPDFQRIAEKVAERYALVTGAPSAEEPEVRTSLDVEMRTLREQLGGKEPDPETDGADGEDEVTDDSLDERPRAVGSGEIGRVLQHGERIAALASTDETRFNELMAAGEQRLRSGQYFWAERYFTRALRFTPGHPLAEAGLAHAQLGAGLYLAASDTLRSLFSHQPEMIDVRYEEGLMPHRTRLLQEVDDLRDRLTGESHRDSYAFLLAYCGHLLEDRAMVTEGLKLMREAAPEAEIIDLLESVWLATEEPQK